MHNQPAMEIQPAYRQCSHLATQLPSGPLLLCGSLILRLCAAMQRLGPKLVACRTTVPIRDLTLLACSACTPDALQMAVEKLKQGIDGFAADQKRLEDLLASIAMGKVKENH